MKPAVLRPAAWSRRICAIGRRTSAWMPVRNTWPVDWVYFWSRLIRGELRQGRHLLMRTIFACLFLCSAFAFGAAAAEPSEETIARGKALVEAGDCASCHTADPAKPFAGGKRIDTPFGGVYSA